MDTHPLALSVIHNSSTYEARTKAFVTMTKRHFAAYALELVNSQARKERIAMNVKHKPRDIDAAVADVIDHHERYHRDVVGSEEREADGIRAIIYLQSMAGLTETPQQAREGWAGMSDEQRENTLIAYKTFQRVNSTVDAGKAVTI